jgi:hypothetical protein
MNRTAELDRRLPQKGSETGLAGKDQAVVMRRLEKQDMKVALSRTGRQEANIELALGSESRSFSLAEFIHFWLTMMEVGLKCDIGELKAGEALRRSKKREKP